MKLSSIVLLITPACLSLRHPASDRVAPGEPRLRSDGHKLNLTSPDGSIAEVDRTIAIRASAVFWPEGYDAIEAGCSLLGMMSTRDSVAARFVRPPHTHTTAASPWTNWDSIEDWGWVSDHVATYDLDVKPSINPAMRELGLPELKLVEDRGTTEPRSWDHTRETTHDGVVYKPTRASMMFLMDAVHGFIIALYTFGPSYEGKRQNPPITVLPKLKNLHDIMYLDYAHVAEEDHQPVTNLKYMFVFDVHNDETKAAVDFALDEELDQWSCTDYLWPNRKTFYPDEEAYKALIASPSGRSMALLLISRKATFGERRIIESISIYCHEPSLPNYNLFFKIKGQEEQDDDSDWTDREETSDPGSPAFSASPLPSTNPASPTGLPP